MTRKALLMALCLCLLAPAAQAGSIIYGGADLLVPAGCTEKLGAATHVKFGQVVSADTTYPQVILWTEFSSTKTGEGDQFDNGSTGFSLLSGTLIKKINAGVYGSFQGGIAKPEGESTEFVSLVCLGFYSDFSSKVRVWLGGGYSNIEGKALYAAQLGLSFDVDWK